MTNGDIKRARALVPDLQRSSLFQTRLAGDTIAALLAERDALSLDAARYVFVRDVMWHNHDHPCWREPRQHLDATIDAAMKGGE